MLTLSSIFLCALGALALAARAGGPRGVALWLAGFGAGAVLFAFPVGPLPIAASAEQSALLVLLMALFLLASPSRKAPAFMPAGGLLAVLWALAMQAQGFTPMLAWAFVVVSVTAAFRFGLARPEFCTRELLREVLVVLSVLATATALIPGVAEGWHTGLGISAVDGAASTLPDASSALALSACCFACGAIHAVFKTHINQGWKSL